VGWQLVSRRDDSTVAAGNGSAGFGVQA